MQSHGPVRGLADGPRRSPRRVLRRARAASPEATHQREEIQESPIMYQSHVKFKWLSSLKHGKSFNIELIHEEPSSIRCRSGQRPGQGKGNEQVRIIYLVTEPSTNLAFTSASASRLPSPQMPTPPRYARCVVFAVACSARLPCQACYYPRCTLVAS
jgi:hypothetical protein